MKIKAVFVSDLHLQARVPRARMEEDWYKVMEEAVAGLYDLAKGGEIPVICAGDVFDHWAPGPELINWAIQHLPRMLCIPGQHDLPGHRYEDRMKGAYGTLCLADTLLDLKPGLNESDFLPFDLYAAPWGQPIPQVPAGLVGKPRVLVAHKYIANSKENAYHGAPPTVQLYAHRAALEGYDLAVFGDNHKGFYSVPPPSGTHPKVFNHGAFIPRNSDEVDYIPRLGCWLADNTFQLVQNDVAALWRTEQLPGAPTQAADYEGYLDALRTLGTTQVPFLGRLEQEALQQPEGVAAALRAVGEHCRNGEKQSI